MGLSKIVYGLALANSCCGIAMASTVTVHQCLHGATLSHQVFLAPKYQLKA